MNNGNLIFIFRSPPYSTPTAQEGMDALLAAAIFDQSISLIFIGDGVFQLNNGQSPAAGKNQMKMLQSLSLYDVDRIYAQQSALVERGMAAEDLCLDCQLISDQTLHQLMANSTHILSF